MQQELYKREIEYKDLKQGMIIQRDGLNYMVEETIYVEQSAAPVAVNLKIPSTFQIISINETDYRLEHEKAPFILMGVSNGQTIRWLQEAPIIEPDPKTHQSFIESITVDGETLKVGQVFKGRTIGKIDIESLSFNGKVQTIFIIKTESGMTFFQTVVYDTPYSIGFGFKEKGEFG